MGNGAKAGRRRTWLIGVILAGAFVAQPTYGQEAGAASSVKHVRPTDRKAGVLLDAGVKRSATFRSIVNTLEHSDLLVWVETRPMRLPGQMQLLAATPVCRHVRVSVRVPGNDTDEIAWLAHELWHAIEVAGAPEVRDQASLQRFYERIGDGGRYAGLVESARAQEIWLKVLYELQSVVERRKAPDHDLGDWLGGRDSCLLATSNASRGVNWKTCRPGTSERLSSEWLAVRDDFRTWVMANAA
jgi:hypothetical protein